MKQQILLAAVLALSLLTVSGCAGEENRGADIGTQSAVQSREDGPSTSSRGEIPEPAPAPEQSEPETPVQDDFVMIGLGEEPLDEETLQLCRAAMNYCESSTGYRPGKDLEMELNVNMDDRSDEEVFRDLKASINKAMPAIKKKVDLNKFKISDSTVSGSAMPSFLSIKDVNQADWVLPNAKQTITMTGLSGPELFAMNPQNSNKNKINTFKQIYGIIYKHIVSAKPKTFEEWMKTTHFSDVDHMYATLFRSTFAGSFFIHHECTCNNVFLQEYQFEDFVKYSDDKAKERIAKIFNSGKASNGEYEVEISQISDDFAVGLKDPTIWSMIMETASLSDKFLSKYEDLIDTMSFIDSVYVIDRESQSLKPVDFGYDAKDPTKSTARKISILANIIQSLSSDSYFELRSRISELFATNSDIGYQIPSAVCPKCGKEIEAMPITAQNLLFMRHQLGALGDISISATQSAASTED